MRLSNPISQIKTILAPLIFFWRACFKQDSSIFRMVFFRDKWVEHTNPQAFAMNTNLFWAFSAWSNMFVFYCRWTKASCMASFLSFLSIIAYCSSFIFFSLRSRLSSDTTDILDDFYGAFGMMELRQSLLVVGGLFCSSLAALLS